MHYRTWYFLITTIFFFHTSHAQNTSCIQAFEGFETIELGDSNFAYPNQTYVPVIAWSNYSHCILVGLPDGLRLYDIDYPDTPLMLVALLGNGINTIAVNSADASIAFGVNQGSALYLITDTRVTSTFGAGNQTITNIAFSPDGKLVAIARSRLDEYGFHYDPEVQIRNLATETQTIVINPDTDIVQNMFFTPNNQYLLVHGVRPGYIGNNVEYWDITKPQREWTYSDLLRGIERWSPNDPLAVETISMQGELLALGGLDGYHDYDEYYGNAVHIWDVIAQERRAQIVLYRRNYSENDEVLADIAFNSQGTILASANQNGLIELWQIPAGNKLAEFDTQSMNIRHIAFSPNDQFLAILAENEIIIWDVERVAEYTSFALTN